MNTRFLKNKRKKNGDAFLEFKVNYCCSAKKVGFLF